MNTAAHHVIFGTGAIGLATLDALRGRGESVRLVNLSGHARVPGEVEVVCETPATRRSPSQSAPAPVWSTRP